MIEVGVVLVENQCLNDTIVKNLGIDVIDNQETIRWEIRRLAERIVQEGLAPE
jgi:hypothetical protein